MNVLHKYGNCSPEDDVVKMFKDRLLICPFIDTSNIGAV